MKSIGHVHCGDVQVTDRGVLLVLLVFLLGVAMAQPCSGATATFENKASIDLLDASAARTYPSTNAVSGITGRVNEVTVTLSNLIHRTPDDLDILLVGPRGQKVILMSDAGGTAAITNTTLRFADRYPDPPPDNSRILPGSYRPSDYPNVTGAMDIFFNPAPPGPYTNRLSVFNGIDPNGTWNLYIMDDLAQTGEVGRLSQGWALTIGWIEPPIIVTQPQSRAVGPGSNATFKVEVTGTPPLGYSWLRNGVTIVPFATGTSTLTLSNVGPGHAGEYSVRITNAIGSVISQPATLYILGPLAIVEEPGDVTLDAGTPSLAMRVTAAGTPPLHYQWYLNGAVIPDGTNSTLVVSNFQARHAGSYTVAVVSTETPDGNPCVATKPSNVRLKTAFLPAAQNQRDMAPLLSGLSGMIAGTNTTADKDPDEPNHAGRPGGRSVWYRWVAPRTGIATFHTQGSGFDTLLAIYTNAPPAGLSPVADDEDAGGYYTSLVRFNMVEGQLYQIAIDGFAGKGGDFLLSWSTLPNVAFPVIAVPPRAQTVPRGTMAKFEVTPANAAQALSYQWFRDGIPIPGANGAAFTDNDVQDADLGNYFVRVSSGANSATLETPPVALEIGPSPSVQFARKLGDLRDFVPPASGFSLAGAVGAGPVAGTIVVPVGDDRSHAFRTNEAPSNVPQVCQICSQGRYFYWLKAVDDGTLVLDTSASDYPIVLGVYELTNTLDKVSLVTCSDENGFAQFTPRRNVTNIIAMEVRKDLENPAPSGGIVRLSWKLVPPCHTLAPGDNLTLTTAPPQVGSGPHRYQWRLDGRNIPGANSATLSLVNVQADDAGTYTVLLGNAVTEELKTIAYVNVEGPLRLKAELLSDPAVGENEEPRFLFLLQARWTKAFVLETKPFLEASDWQPVLTNSDPCQALMYLSPLAEPQAFFRAVEWSP